MSRNDLQLRDESDMDRLKGYQRQYLKGLAHEMKPLVFIGSKGISPAVVKALEEALENHELVKMKFNDFKEKDQKKEIGETLAKETASEMIGMVGHVAIFFRPQREAEKRKIEVPQRRLA